MNLNIMKNQLLIYTIIFSLVVSLLIFLDWLVRGTRFTEINPEENKFAQKYVGVEFCTLRDFVVIQHENDSFGCVEYCELSLGTLNDSTYTATDKATFNTAESNQEKLYTNSYILEKGTKIRISKIVFSSSLVGGSNYVPLASINEKKYKDKFVDIGVLFNPPWPAKIESEVAIINEQYVHKCVD